MTTLDKNGTITNTLNDTLYLYFPTATENDVNIDWTGWTAKMQIKEKATDETALIEITDTTGIDISVNGKLTITIPATTMDNLSLGEYVWDLQMTRSGGRVETWFTNSKLKLIQDVTR